MHDLRLPIHPTKRHPLTGLPIQAIYVRRDGRVMWPILGGDDTVPPAPPAAPAATPPAPAAPAGGRQNATDAQGNDLGFPKDTPTVEMSDKEQAAYWRHNARKHEGLWKGVAGDRKLDDVQRDLQELAEIRQAQMTPAEQALTAARDEGKAEGVKSERRNTATEIFRGALATLGIEGDDLDEYVTNFNVDAYIGDDRVDTTKITNFAKKLVPSGTDDKQRTRDFGGGNRGSGGDTRPGSVAQVMAARAAAREGKTSTSTS